MTYLDIINNVLRRLREEEATTYNETDYSTMIGDLVNDAMDVCQNAWNWSALFTEIDVNTVASTQTVTLDGIGQQGQIYLALNDTSNHYLTKRSRAWMSSQTNMSGTDEGPPMYYAPNSLAADDDMIVDLWPIPDDVYALKFHVKQQQPAMAADDAVLIIPEQPIIQLALAYALDERGDTGGTNSSMQTMKANNVLSDYIALDSANHPETLIWTEG